MLPLKSVLRLDRWSMKFARRSKVFWMRRRKRMDEKIREEKLKAEVIDVTLPSKKNVVGHRHPNTIALEEVERIFVGMGYEVIEGPEVEYDLYNFEN